MEFNVRVNEILTLNKAIFIFNTDESGFKFYPSRFRGIWENGKSLYKFCRGSGRDSYTLLAYVSVNGSMMPHMILFKSATRVQPRWVSDNPFHGIHCAVSTNGWMKGQVFLNWFTNRYS